MSGRLVQELNDCTVALIRKLRWSLRRLAYILAHYSCMLLQPGPKRRLVDWYRNEMSILYLIAVCVEGLV